MILQNGEDDKTRGTLLVVDRFCDLTFPVMHDFGLQAASYDVLGLDETGDTFTYVNQCIGSGLY